MSVLAGIQEACRSLTVVPSERPATTTPPKLGGHTVGMAMEETGCQGDSPHCCVGEHDALEHLTMEALVLIPVSVQHHCRVQPSYIQPGSAWGGVCPFIVVKS